MGDSLTIVFFCDIIKSCSTLGAIMLRKMVGNGIGIGLIVTPFLLLADAALTVPVTEIGPSGTCLRVINHEGKKVKNGCKLVAQGKLSANERHVAR